MSYLVEIPTDEDNLFRRQSTVKNFLREVKKTTPHLLNTLKAHLTVHIPDHLMRFGPMKAYSTER